MTHPKSCQCWHCKENKGKDIRWCPMCNKFDYDNMESWCESCYKAALIDAINAPKVQKFKKKFEDKLSKIEKYPDDSFEKSKYVEKQVRLFINERIRQKYL